MKKFTLILIPMLIFVIVVSGCAPATPDQPKAISHSAQDGIQMASLSASPVMVEKEVRPLHFSGFGNQSVTLNKWDGPAVLHLTNNGKRNFFVTYYDKNGEKLVADSIIQDGNWDGYVSLDFHPYQQTASLNVESDGDWTADVFPLDAQYLHKAQFNKPYEGNGFDFVLVYGGDGSSMKSVSFKTDSTTNFYVTTHSVTQHSGIPPYINAIGPYNGSIVLEDDVILIEVQAKGKWTMELKAQ